METEIRWTDASCATSDKRVLHLFFSEEPAEIEEARSLCRTCTLRVQCLKGAVERREQEGVWGGYLFDRGRAVAMKQPRGRPPKELLRRQAHIERELVALGIGDAPIREPGTDVQHGSQRELVEAGSA